MTAPQPPRTVVVALPLRRLREAGRLTGNAVRASVATTLAAGLVAGPALVLGSQDAPTGSPAFDGVALAAPAAAAYPGADDAQFLPDLAPSVVGLGGVFPSTVPGSSLGSRLDLASGRSVLGIPAIMLDAYRRADVTMKRLDPSCGLPWWLLAGIGRRETLHMYGGQVDATGRATTPIFGPRLDGSLAGTAVIRDSDKGALDLDPAFDRAVGPMQFIPSTWRAFGADNSGDGKAEPQNVYDASLAAGKLLCSYGDLRTEAAMRTAVFRYNHSQAYVNNVLAWGNAYRLGAVPTDSYGDGIPGWVPTGIPSSTPTPKPTTPATPSPTTTTTATPTATTTTTTTATPTATQTTTATSTPTATSTSTPTATSTSTTTAEPTTTTTTEPTSTETTTATATSTPTEEPSGSGSTSSSTDGTGTTGVTGSSAPESEEPTPVNTMSTVSDLTGTTE